MVRSITISEFLSNPAVGLAEFVEIDLLSKTVENTAWHHGQSLWDHGTHAYRSVDKIISLDDPFLAALHPIKSDIAAYMDSTLCTHTRRVLLKVAALLHDVGKITHFQTGISEQTACPGHADESKKMFEKKCGVLPLPIREREYVAGLIGNHHNVDRFLSCQDEEHCAIEFENFRRENEHITIDLLIFFLCNFEGSKINYMVKRQKPRLWNRVCGALFEEFEERLNPKIKTDDEEAWE